MRKYLLFIACLLVSNALSATSFVFGESVDVTNHEHLIGLILENREYCAEEVTDSDIRLKPDQLYPTKEGLFLRINQFDLVRLPYVLSDSDGCAISMSSEGL